MGMKIVLVASAALVGMAYTTSAYADEPGKGSRLRPECGDKANPCVVEADPVNQAGYPFGPPSKLPDGDLDKIREGVLKENLGTMLNPGEIGAVQNRKLDAQGAAAYPGYAGQALPAARRLDIGYRRGPEQGPQDLWLAQNVPSPISFEDTYGNPWPIVSIAYDPRIYSVNGQGCGQNSEPKMVSEDRPTFITVSPCKFWTWGTFTVQLQGINVPVVFVAGSGNVESRKYVDVPVVVHVDGLSPTGKKPQRKYRGKAPPRKKPESGPSSAYQAFLNGTPPSGAMRVGTNDGNSSAWLYEGNLYLVAPYRVITPAYEAIASANNKNVFRFHRATSRVLAAASDGSERVISIGN